MMMRRISTVAVAVGLTLLAGVSRADDARAGIDWGRAVADTQAWVLRNAERGDRPDWVGEAAAKQPATSFGHAWFGVAPTVTLVARDWGHSHLVSGRLPATEAMRLSRSSRMVVSRFRLAGGRITPFAQLGLGEWRIDRDLLPEAPRNIELAAQVGGGFEVQLVRGWELVLESNATIIYREQREPQNIPTPRLFGSMLATRFQF
jgi:hypothetical protein